MGVQIVEQSVQKHCLISCDLDYISQWLKWKMEHKNLDLE